MTYNTGETNEGHVLTKHYRSDVGISYRKYIAVNAHYAKVIAIIFKVNIVYLESFKKIGPFNPRNGDEPMDVMLFTIHGNSQTFFLEYESGYSIHSEGRAVSCK